MVQSEKELMLPKKEDSRILCFIFREVEEGGRVNGGVITLKFEPFILHVQCRNTEAAKRLHTISLEAGYRNSGITLGKSGKVTLAVRYDARSVWF